MEAVAVTQGIVDPAFWRGRKVFVTGHTGFKGGWLCLWLESLGAEVTGYALPPPTRPSLFEAAGVAAGVRHIEGDIRDFGALREALRQSRAEVLLHLAAQPLVRNSYRDPLGTYGTNVMGTAHALEAVRCSDTVRAVIVVTTDKCYENGERETPYAESDSLGGHDPYSSSKACAELVAAAYRRSFLGEHGIAVATARAGNVIGGGDWAEDRLVPDFFRALESRSPLEIRNPGAIRPWQHVLEPLAGYLLLAQGLISEPTACAGAWNFGPPENDMATVRHVVEELSRRVANPPVLVLPTAAQPHEAKLLLLDSAKARHRLSWRNGLKLGDALAMTTDWYNHWLSGTDMRKASLQQIRDYAA